MSNLPSPKRLLRIQATFGCSFSEYAQIEVVDGAIDAFIIQRAHAKYRGIPFKFNLPQWWVVWKTSGHWQDRGRQADEYCMCRTGDVGAYEVGNVFIAKMKENSSAPSRKSPRMKKKLPMGVARPNSREKYIARRRIGGRQIHLGSFETPELAHAAYLAGAQS